MKLRNEDKEGKPVEEAKEEHFAPQSKSYHQIAFDPLGLEIMKHKTPQENSLKHNLSLAHLIEGWLRRIWRCRHDIYVYWIDERTGEIMWS